MGVKLAVVEAVSIVPSTLDTTTMLTSALPVQGLLDVDCGSSCRSVVLCNHDSKRSNGFSAVIAVYSRVLVEHLHDRLDVT